jgi:uncharacterized protein (DUF2267 family)
MSATGLKVFDTTLQKTNSWLHEIMREMGCQERREAYQALRATLHALRDRLTIEEVAQLAAQLPMLVRGFYYEGWDPSGKPVKARDPEAFLALIAKELRGDDEIDADRAARAVFAVLARRITQGELEDIQGLLPKEIHRLWPPSEDLGAQAVPAHRI